MPSKEKTILADLRCDNKLFSEMYVSTHIRQGDMGEFFAHENSPYPPSLSINGSMRLGNKSDLVSCLIEHCQLCPTAPHVTAKVFDGGAVIHMLRPAGSKTLKDYATDILIPYIQVQLYSCQRIDIVWDTYEAHSLKEGTRKKRGL